VVVHGDRLSCVHEVMLSVDRRFDDRAPGGAVTIRLCGTLEHDPPCPLAPHHTVASVSDSIARVRVVFACDPTRESEIRSRIEASLTAGSFRGPDGVRTEWQFLNAQSAQLDASEEPIAQRLLTV
jgi:hypothetical protein